MKIVVVYFSFLWSWDESTTQDYLFCMHFIYSSTKVIFKYLHIKSPLWHSRSDEYRLYETACSLALVYMYTINTFII